MNHLNYNKNSLYDPKFPLYPNIEKIKRSSLLALLEITIQQSHNVDKNLYIYNYTNVNTNYVHKGFSNQFKNNYYFICKVNLQVNIDVTCYFTIFFFLFHLLTQMSDSSLNP